jgi:hypothetical protein
MLPGRSVLVWLVLLGSLQVVQGGTTVVVFKEGIDVTTGGAVDSIFSGVGSGDVAIQVVHDTYIVGNPAAAWTVFGNSTSSTGTLLFKFDVSAILANATVYKAQLRLRATGGNTAATCARIVTRSWDEAVCTLAGPDGPAKPATTWGPASNAIFSSADYVAPANFESAPGGTAWLVKDVTADVQAFVAGTLPNLGWYVGSGNHPVVMSENGTDGERPALFVHYYAPGTQPPTPIADLATSEPGLHKLTLTWTAPNDDSGPGNAAASYDVRYSTGLIDDANFAAASALPQTLTPKTPGQTETLFAADLDPDTTYYFAVKSADIDGMTSELSNVAVGRTAEYDLTPPAAVSDLAAAPGVEPFSAALSWTATGDDGLLGQATRYEVRFALEPIDEANWSSATKVPNSLAPSPAGGVDDLTIAGLQPATTHYFALRVWDEQDNASLLSNVASLTTGPLPELPLVARVTLIEKDGVTTANQPITLSHAFRKGDVADCVTVRVAGQALATQTDVKVRYEDGSVKHALISFVLPSFQASSQVSVELLAGGVNANSYPIDKDFLLQRDFDANLAITIGGQTTVVSARQMLQAVADPDTWIHGDICTEFLLIDFGNNINDQLNVQYRVRVYRGSDGYRVDAVVENCRCEYRGNVTYDFTYTVGQASPVTVLSKTGFLHNQLARWHTTAWGGSAPSDIQVVFDVPYLVSTGLIQRYDTSLVMPESTLASQYSNWLSAGRDLMDNGIVTMYFGTTGGRQEIGVLPTWTVRWLLSMDRRQEQIMMHCADVSGYIPIHYRESDRYRSFFGRVMSIDDRPTIWNNWWDFSGTLTEDSIGPPVGDTNTGWSVDMAHQASFAYVPYLVTGEYYYLEEMIFWAGWNLSWGNTAYRQGSLGIVQEQVRGEAWGIRNVADAANLAPDGSPEKAYLRQKVLNNLTYWTNSNVPGAYGAVRFWGKQSMVERPDGSFEPTCMYYISPWQEDFVLLVLAHLKDIGFDARALVNWLGKTAIDRFSAQGFNWFRGSSYHIPVEYNDGAGNPIPYTTWADVEATFVNAAPTTFGDNPGNYDYIARAALTRVAHLANGQAARSWLDGQLRNQASLATDPTMAILPTPAIVGDVNSDGHVDVEDLLYLVEAFGQVYGSPLFNPDCDFDGDASADVADLLIFVENFGK